MNDMKRETPETTSTPSGALVRRRPGQHGPQKAPTKQIISIRLDADLLAKFRATGPGWQSRINAVLVKYAPRRAGKTIATKGATK